MGFMSRKVLPVCGNLCFFCPSMRARSRQPVKRYKKLLAEIFPRSQDAEPNDRKIGKLCDYASKNPLRIPKITEYLEQRFYKDLRNQQFGSVKVVLCIYRKLLSSCKEQMPLFAGSLLGIIRTLLEQTGQDEMRILGCIVLVDFINSQTDSSYMFNLEGFIPKLCQLAQEVGDGERTLRFRSAGLQALAFMVWFMGEHSHVAMDFDNIISVTLENYMDLPLNPETPTLGATEAEDHSSSLPEDSKKVPSILNLINFKCELDPKEGTSKSPSYWSMICLQNMARLAKEATTVRRVLEPLFQCFDSDNHWSSEKGLACSVLTYMQMLLEESGLNSHLLLSILVKHLDHKSIVKQPSKQINIVKVIIKIAENAKTEASGAITGAIADLIKHLRKSMQCSAETSNSVNGVSKYYSDLELAIENCIRQLSIKVGDMGPILDMMAVTLESIPTNAIAARMTLFSVYRTTEIVSSIPNVSYHQKTFPDALFHQLLIAMAHPDHETRIVAHHVFSLLLMPSLICPWRVKSRSFTIQDDGRDKTESLEGDEGSVDSAIKFSFPDQSYSFKHGMVDKEAELSTFKLSSHQVNMLLSAIWMQAISAENTPGNFEAMAHTYNIALLFSRYKNSGRKTLVRCFQLAFSLRAISLDNEVLQPSRKRSLFTMATCMLIFSARAGNVPEIIPLIKSSLTHITIDPYLKLVEDIRLHAVSEGVAYGSQEDEVAALKSHPTIELGDKQLRETVISHLVAKFSDLSEDELLDIRKQLFEGFTADDLYPMGAPSFMETSRACSPLAQTESLLFDEIMAEDGLTDEEAFSEPNGSQSERNTSSSITSLDVLSVNQLLESVRETARHVANLPVSSTLIPYDQVKNECEALVTGKHQKMSVLRSFKVQEDGNDKAIVLSTEQEKIKSSSNGKIEFSEDLRLINIEHIIAGDKQLLSGSIQCTQQESFRLPPSSPYDKFLKAASC